MFDEMKQMMNMMKNVDTKKIQWFHQLMGELRKQQLEKNKKKLNDNAKSLYDDVMVSSLMPIIEMIIVQLKLNPVKSLNSISDSYVAGKTPEETIEDLLINAKKK